MATSLKWLWLCSIDYFSPQTDTIFSASYDVDNDDEVETSTTRLQSITPEEWADIKKLTKQESIRPSEIEGTISFYNTFLIRRTGNTLGANSVAV